MTIETTDDRLKQYNGSGGTGPFAFPFKFFADTDLVVIQTDADGLDSTLTLTTDYTVSGAGDPEGGSVTTEENVEIGEKITIYQDQPAKQESDYITAGKFKADTLEDDLDKLVILIQQIKELIGRCLRIPVSSDVTVDTQLPKPTASSFLAWNAEATALINAAGMVSVPVSTAMATLLDDESVAAALTTLGFSAFIQSLISTTDENDLLSLFDNPSSGSISKLNWLQGLISKQAGLTWRNYDSANSSNEYRSVAWSPELGLLAAVARTGTNTIQTSPDGRNWTEQVAPWKSWQTIIWAPGVGGGEGLFVAIGYGGDNELVMTSPDSINWTFRTVPGSNNWSGLAYSPDLELFVATAYSGSSTGQFVMTSPDAINWTLRNTPADEDWVEVKWIHELSLFVAISCTGPAGQTVMTSSDGITWTLRNTPADNSWRGLAWSPDLNLLVAVGYSGTGDRIMTSPDGINWTLRSSPADNSWFSVDWSPELGIFAAVAGSGSDPRVMTSDDGINWTLRDEDVLEDPWRSIVWAKELGLFCAVSSKDFSNKVMLSGIFLGY